MKPATIWGTITRVGALVGSYNSAGQLTGARSYDDFETSLSDSVDLDLGHDGRKIGEATFLDINRDGRLRGAFVLDDSATLDDIDSPLYFSPRLLAIGDALPPSRGTFIARTAQLLAVALTDQPATLGAEAIRMRHGDLRRPPHRARWGLDWSRDDLLQRAVADAGNRADALAGWIHDRRASEPSNWNVDPWTGRPSSTPATRARPGQPWVHGGGHVIAVR